MQLTDMLFAELPRVRLDRIRRPTKFLFDAPPTLSEVPEECEGYLEDQSQYIDDFQQRLDLNTTLNSPLGKSRNSLQKQLMQQNMREIWKEISLVFSTTKRNLRNVSQ